MIPGATQLEFQDVHVVTVIFLVLVLVFIRTIASTIVEVLRALEAVWSGSCLGVGCGLHESAALYLVRCALILFCFSQPAIFAVLHYLRHTAGKAPVTVLFVEQTNADNMDCVTRVYNTSTVWDVLHHDADVLSCFDVKSLVKVDALLLILPFAFAISVSSMTWVHYNKQGVISIQSMWDDTLSSDIFYYELSYMVERFASNACFIALYSTGISLIYVGVCALLFTLVQVFYSVLSRMAQREWQVQTFSVFLLIVVVSLWTPLWMSNLASYKWLAILLLMTHTITIFADILLNLLAEGGLMASTMILFRLVLQCVSSVALIVFLCSQ